MFGIIDALGNELAENIDRMMAPGVTVEWQYSPDWNLGAGGGLVWVEYEAMPISTGWEVKPYLAASKMPVEDLAKVAARDICNTLAHRAGRYFLAGVPK